MLHKILGFLWEFVILNEIPWIFELSQEVTKFHEKSWNSRKIKKFIKMSWKFVKSHDILVKIENHGALSLPDWSKVK